MNMVNEGVLPPDELDDRDERREERKIAQKREMLADIIAMLRANARGERTDYFSFTGLADRIEAAWKRDEERAVEHATRHAEAVARDNCRDCVHNPKGKNYEGGNAAAMREAMVEALNKVNDAYDMLSKPCVTLEEVRQACQEARGIIIPALSEPARNCDRYKNKKDAEAAFISEECKHPCGNCTVNDEYGCALVHECGVDWLFATAEREGVTKDGE